MTTQHQENSCKRLQELLDQSALEKTEETLQSEEVVMEEDGHLRYRNISHSDGSSWRSQKREELAESRKKLVLGLGEYNKHSLSEANAIIERRWHEYKQEHTSPVGKAVNFIKDRL